MPLTHLPHRNGAVCGKYPVPVDARDYSVDDPTCPKCLAYKQGLDRMAPNPSRTDAPAPAAPPKKKSKSDDE